MPVPNVCLRYACACSAAVPMPMLPHCGSSIVSDAKWVKYAQMALPANPTWCLEPVTIDVVKRCEHAVTIGYVYTVQFESSLLLTHLTHSLCSYQSSQPL